MKLNTLYKNDIKDLNQVETGYLKGTYLDIFGNFETELHGGKYFIHLYNELCHSYTVYTNTDLEIFLKEVTLQYNLTEDDFILRDEQSKTSQVDKIDYNLSSYFLRIKERLLIEIHPYKTVFWYGKSVEFSEISRIIKIIESSKRQRKHIKKFYMVAASSRSEYGFEFKKFNIKNVKIDLNENYNEDFERIDGIINKFLNEDNKNGLILLHGKHGTGKTTYIRQLMSTINRRFIFLPLNLMEAINAPSFLPFISKYNDSVLVLEDCEDLLTPRGNNNYTNNSLVNLLNLGDGLLSDALSFKIICTFNANIKQIDQAILRKGRLVARYEFKELEIPRVQLLFDKLKIEEKADKPLTLAEIFNKDTIDFGDVSQSKKIGF